MAGPDSFHACLNHFKSVMNLRVEGTQVEVGGTLRDFSETFKLCREARPQKRSREEARSEVRGENKRPPPIVSPSHMSQAQLSEAVEAQLTGHETVDEVLQGISPSALG